MLRTPVFISNSDFVGSGQYVLNLTFSPLYSYLAPFLNIGDNVEDSAANIYTILDLGGPTFTDGNLIRVQYVNNNTLPVVDTIAYTSLAFTPGDANVFVPPYQGLGTINSASVAVPTLYTWTVSATFDPSLLSQVALGDQILDATGKAYTIRFIDPILGFGNMTLQEVIYEGVAPAIGDASIYRPTPRFGFFQGLAPNPTALLVAQERDFANIDVNMAPTGPQGATGVAGATGALGNTGLQGAIGFTGIQGIQGVTGPRGVDGTTGAHGGTGYPGPQGAPGERGPQGQQGETGHAGQAGPTGAPGTPGSTGPRGLQGMMGVTGVQGVDGQTGPTGEQGVTGLTGIPGVTGVQGIAGTPGPTGLGVTGPIGLQGQQGETGPIGPAGGTGALGVTGLPGPTGSKGSTGAAGSTGLQGETGAVGLQGTTGAVGSQGIPGNPGVTGLQGITGVGAQGATGIGAQGVTGATGIQGARGLTGAMGVTGLQGVTGYGIQGATGKHGYRGYQGETGVQGNTGVGGGQGSTGLQGITGIQGTKGMTGPQGATGVQGVQGDTGLTGETGVQGATGTQGIQGITGVMGQTGLQGQTGVQGTTGVAGATGVIGPAGQTGIQGVIGFTGVQGQTGVGETGAQGPTGFQGVTGVQGQTGYGIQGATGLQGPTGFQGVTGINGTIGVNGETGPQGVTGVQGETGTFGSAAFENVNMAGFNIINLANPVNPQDAATKAYVDANGGVDIETAVNGSVPYTMSASAGLTLVMNIDSGYTDNSQAIYLPDATTLQTGTKVTIATYAPIGQTQQTTHITVFNNDGSALGSSNPTLYWNEALTFVCLNTASANGSWQIYSQTISNDNDGNLYLAGDLALWNGGTVQTDNISASQASVITIDDSMTFSGSPQPEIWTVATLDNGVGSGVYATGPNGGSTYVWLNINGGTVYTASGTDYNSAVANLISTYSSGYPFTLSSGGAGILVTDTTPDQSFILAPVFGGQSLPQAPYDGAPWSGTFTSNFSGARVYQSAGPVASQTLSLVVDPVNPQDVATKHYVDNLTAGANTSLSNLSNVSVNTSLIFHAPAAQEQWTVASLDYGVGGGGFYGTSTYVWLVIGNSYIWASGTSYADAIANLIAGDVDSGDLSGYTLAASGAGFTITSVSTTVEFTLYPATSDGVDAGYPPSFTAWNGTFVSNFSATITQPGPTAAYSILNLIDPVNPHDAANKEYVDNNIDYVEGAYLSRSGGTMTGAINMGSNSITSLNDPVNPQDAMTKHYADETYLFKAGDTMTGTLNMNSNPITNVPTPVNPDDAANKAYADLMLPLTGGTMSGNISMAGHTITSEATPVNPNDVPNKAYVDAAGNGLIWQTPISDTCLADDSLSTPPVEYTFAVTAANATAGAIYTNNGNTFKVVATISGSTTLTTFGSGASTSSGTLTLSSGSGDATITFSEVSSDYPYSVLFILAAAGTGAWAGIAAGHAVQYIVPEGTTGSPQWVDLFNRAVQTGDRFLIDHNAQIGMLGGSFVGQYNTICQVTGGSPGAYTYSFTTPLTQWTVLDNSPNSDHFGQSYTYDGTSSQWVQVGGPAVVSPGVALAYAANTLNVQIDNSTITTNVTNQLEVAPGGITNTQVNASAAIAYSKLANLGGATNDVLVQNSSGYVAPSTISSTNLFLADGSVPATGAFNLSNFQINNLGTPTGPQDAATKAYADSLVMTGHTGVQGQTGVQGATGVQGIQGNTGVQGQTGIQGIQGIQGATGVQGIQGNTGVYGQTGVQGQTGVGYIGSDGHTGPQGVTGIQGVTGTAGTIGVNGATGPQGVTGVFGGQIRAGSVAISNGATSVSVVFSSTLGTTNYAVMSIMINTIDAEPQFQPITITAQSATGFTATWNDNTDSANYSLMYIAALNQ